jgi:ABC transporter substrate binding protein
MRRKVDVILALYESTLKAALAAKTTVPILMIAVDYDPIAHGYVKSLAQPGGNVTGLYLQQIDLARKRVELLTQALPNVKAATVFWEFGSEDQWNATRSAAAAAGLRIADVEFRETKARWTRYRLTIAALSFFRSRQCFIATGSGSRTSLFGIKLQRYFLCANGSPSRRLYRQEAGRYSASSRMTLIRSDLPSKPIPGSSGMTI